MELLLDIRKPNILEGKKMCLSWDVTEAICDVWRGSGPKKDLATEIQNL